MILCLVEHAQGAPTSLSLEMLAMAGRLAVDAGQPLHATVIGKDVSGVAATLGGAGIATVYEVEDGRLDAFAPDAWAAALLAVIERNEPAAVLGPGSDRSHDVLARAAARLDKPLCANALAIDAGETYRITRVCWGGSLYEEVALEGTPKLLTIAPHVVEPAAAGGGAVPERVPVDVDLAEEDLRVHVVDQIPPDREGISLGDAHVVVGGGRGVGSSEGFEVLDELAALLGGAVGCSRAVTSNGWRPHADQIGQTGERIAPQLYVACGISGASQHMAGCSGAKKLLVINSDAEAPILAKADYAVIGDLHEVLPAVIDEIKRRR